MYCTNRLKFFARTHDFQRHHWRIEFKAAGFGLLNVQNNGKLIVKGFWMALAAGHCLRALTDPFAISFRLSR
ncbi:hypothetical protein MITS9509_01518 [Synechococcus sp. MIT S9509]|nr:hypothetical protein MITS9504_01134 [Synechococcus sp. MIT S9504]KZR92527.1 hypothetical protein MITS9509_01518 [Synechococcus sp. MIT S9509]